MGELKVDSCPFLVVIVWSVCLDLVAHRKSTKVLGVRLREDD